MQLRLLCAEVGAVSEIDSCFVALIRSIPWCEGHFSKNVTQAEGLFWLVSSSLCAQRETRPPLDRRVPRREWRLTFHFR
jgi:hypothetical protein